MRRPQWWVTLKALPQRSMDLFLPERVIEVENDLTCGGNIVILFMGFPGVKRLFDLRMFIESSESLRGRSNFPSTDDSLWVYRAPPYWVSNGDGVSGRRSPWKHQELRRGFRNGARQGVVGSERIVLRLGVENGRTVTRRHVSSFLRARARACVCVSVWWMDPDSW